MQALNQTGLIATAFATLSCKNQCV